MYTVFNMQFFYNCTYTHACPQQIPFITFVSIYVHCFQHTEPVFCNCLIIVLLYTRNSSEYVSRPWRWWTVEVVNSGGGGVWRWWSVEVVNSGGGGVWRWWTVEVVDHMEVVDRGGGEQWRWWTVEVVDRGGGGPYEGGGPWRWWSIWRWWTVEVVVDHAGGETP